MSHNWKNILIPPTESIHKALAIIDSEALQLALVVDSAGGLLGSVTDGDIRRALIKGTHLDEPVSHIMFSNPTTVKEGTPREEILALMDLKKLISIPVIKNGLVVGLETLHKAMHKAKYENPVFIMAGGFGTRLRPLTNHCPKPMLKVGDKPILETVILQFIKSGFCNFYISTHYLPEIIKEYFGDGSKWNVSIEYVYEEEPLGTGGALGLLPASIPDLPLIMINGDVLTNLDFSKLITFHNKKNSDATMCVREYEYQVPYGVVELEGNLVKGMAEKPIHHFFVNAGIYVINPFIIQSVKENIIIDMPTLLENNIANGKSVFNFPLNGYWLDIGRIDDYNRAQKDIENLDLY
jgi:dTDP-glucose pyrophosphorylase